MVLSGASADPSANLWGILFTESNKRSSGRNVTGKQLVSLIAVGALLMPRERGTTTQHPQLARPVTRMSSGLRGQKQCQARATPDWGGARTHTADPGHVPGPRGPTRKCAPGLAASRATRAAGSGTWAGGCPSPALGRPSVGTSALPSQLREAGRSPGTRLGLTIFWSGWHKLGLRSPVTVKFWEWGKEVRI